MNVVCVMCIHRRIEVTRVAIKHLKLHLKNIILVGDSNIERTFAKEMDCHYVEHSNSPLGDKWQVGLYAARQMKPKAVLISGSDDLLTHDWIKTCMRHIHLGCDLVGKNERFVLRIEKDQPFQLVMKKYKTERLLGAGRVYSRKLLNQLNWKLFDSIDSRLDGSATKRVNEVGGVVRILDDYDIQVLLMKGDWDCLNPWNVTKNINKICNVKDVAGWLQMYFPEAISDLQQLRLGYDD